MACTNDRRPKKYFSSLCSSSDVHKSDGTQMLTDSTTYFALSYCDWSIQAWMKRNPNAEIDELSVAVSGEGVREQARFFILYRDSSKETE